MEHKKRIIIVEDDEALSRVIMQELADAGFDAISASDGEEGWKLISTKKPDLVLLDLIVPKKDGFSLLKDMRADEALRTVPAIILTNLQDMSKVADAVSEGASEYLVKSEWGVKDVVAKVKEHLLKEENKGK